VGYGDIGRATARIARAFRMRVVALRRRAHLSAEEQREGLLVGREEGCSGGSSLESGSYEWLPSKDQGVIICMQDRTNCILMIKVMARQPGFLFSAGARVCGGGGG
jgi:hypothetical protein